MKENEEKTQDLDSEELKEAFDIIGKGIANIEDKIKEMRQAPSGKCSCHQPKK